jgi:hypothetical protein
MAYDWNGGRTRRVVFAKRLPIVRLLVFLVAITAIPMFSVR